MAKIIRLSYILVIIVVFVVLGCARTLPVKRDMVRFDRIYIPALVFAGAGDLEKTMEYLRLAEDEWMQFRVKYLDYSNDDNQWNADLNKILSIIESARADLEAQKQPGAIRKDMEEVRSIMYLLRQRNGISYYLDTITVFHNAMDPVFSIEQKSALKPVSADESAAIHASIVAAEDAWERVMYDPFDAVLFMFDEEQVKQLNSMIGQGSELLSSLESAVQENEDNDVNMIIHELKKTYTTMFTLFGDFSLVDKQES